MPTETTTYVPSADTLEKMTDYLISGYWASVGGPASSFDTSSSNEITVNLGGLTAAGQQLARWALASWELVANVSFTETSGSADITFSDDQAGAYSGYLSSGGNTISAEVNISTAWISSHGTLIGSYGLYTYIHEIGHALGLGHQGPYDGGADYASDAAFTEDSWQLSVMSYFSQTENSSVDADYAVPVTPMTVDILAIQELYGASTVTAGDTVWGADSTLDGLLGTLFAALYDGGSTAQIASQAITLTIYDYSGHDTIDVSPSGNAQRITLEAGGISDLEGLTGNLVIAQGTVIEDLYTGSGNDTLTGNDADNLIDAGAGDDLLTGGAGDDTLIGGVGSDSALYDVALSAAQIEISGDGFLITTAEGTDYLEGIETFVFADGTVYADDLLGTPVTVTGSSGADILAGDTGADLLSGLDGNDYIDGKSGSDEIYGGNGRDSLLGRDGDDTIDGGAGADNIAAGNGDDLVYGGEGNDSIGGGAGNDSLHGDAGRDTIGGGTGDDYIDTGDDRDAASGGYGNDTLLGGEGNDTLAGSHDDDTVDGGSGNDDLGGGAGADLLRGGAGNDTLGAGDGNDTLQGQSGEDFLGGGAGRDLLLGGGDDDTLNGGWGNDTLTGGEGADLFLFNQLVSGETDRITDFETGTDLIRLNGTSYGALSITDSAEGAQISVSGHVIVLEGVSASALDAGDFLFV